MSAATILITGASGFIGSHLLPFLLERNFRVVALSRKNQVSTHPNLRWVQKLSQVDNEMIDYVINLAGESIGKGHWGSARKQQLIDSRVQTTTKVFDWLKQHAHRPKMIISGSAVGYYGIDEREQWTNLCDESASPQAIFMSELCQKWEQSALAYSNEFNIKIMRLGIVFAREGGILPQMLQPIKWRLVGKIGHGRQPVTWVHIADVLGVIEFLMKHQPDAQIFNVVSPEQVTQQQFAQCAAHYLQVRPLLSAPSIAFKWLMGEQSQLILNGQFVQPKALLNAGYHFHYPTLDQALQQILA
ncbi:TIGR01777 family oxidoreductase [Acinetobacter sp. MB5]|uniref:TIGR01777 family oxidoreductase n=1 Tax=Acinetobacter sp. MB5 TaxID=2069438 RepID=UPI000DD0DF71|nr:TIGR01777 family oxidoreductase [Acinetobacter sp. MB5]